MGRYVTPFLLAITALAWTGLIVEGFLDALNGKGFAVVCVVAALAPVLAAIRAHSLQVQRDTTNHIERLELALQHHAGLLAEHQSIVARIVDVWGHAHVGADRDATAWAGSTPDTGPFPLYRNGSKF